MTKFLSHQRCLFLNLSIGALLKINDKCSDRVSKRCDRTVVQHLSEIVQDLCF